MVRSWAGRVVYKTATSLDGFIADESNSLGWLFAIERTDAEAGQHVEFLERVGVLVEGSTTYEWVLAEVNLLAEPHKWQGFYGDRPTFVFSSRKLPRPRGADVRFVHGPVGKALPDIVAAAGKKDVWVVGGGDLAGQFFDAGALNKIEVSVAPVTLGRGAPLLPRRIESNQMSLLSASTGAQFIHATYAITYSGSA
jgi:dihydrofolate reductase